MFSIGMNFGEAARVRLGERRRWITIVVHEKTDTIAMQNNKY